MAKFKAKKSGNCKGCNREVALLGDDIAKGNIPAFTKERVKEVGFFCNSCGDIFCGACCLPSWLLAESGTTPALPECPVCKSRVDFAKPEHRK